MATTNPYFRLVKTSNSSWAAVHMHDDVLSARNAFNGRAVEPAGFGVIEEARESLFGETTEAHAAFAERFPKLTIAMISLALFAVSITAEVEWLHQAGYYWR